MNIVDDRTIWPILRACLEKPHDHSLRLVLANDLLDRELANDLFLAAIRHPESAWGTDSNGILVVRFDLKKVLAEMFGIQEEGWMGTYGVSFVPFGLLDKELYCCHRDDCPATKNLYPDSLGMTCPLHTYYGTWCGTDIAQVSFSTAWAYPIAQGPIRPGQLIQYRADTGTYAPAMGTYGRSIIGSFTSSTEAQDINFIMNPEIARQIAANYTLEATPSAETDDSITMGTIHSDTMTRGVR